MSFFDEYVDFFDQVQKTSWYRQLLHDFAEFIEITPEAKVLDVGCGAGYLTRFLAERVRAVGCVDLSTNMVERARERAMEEGIENAYYSVGSAESLPEQSDYYEIVVSTSVVYFLSEPTAALREMARTVKAGGRVAMMNPSDKMTDQNVLHTIVQLKLAGFEAESLQDWLAAARGARRLTEAYASKIMEEAGLTQITHERHLNDMVLFSKGIKPPK